MFRVAFKFYRHTKPFRINKKPYFSRNISGGFVEQDNLIKGTELNVSKGTNKINQEIRIFSESDNNIKYDNFSSEILTENDIEENYLMETDFSPNCDGSGIGDIKSTVESLKADIAKISLNDLSNLPNNIYNIGPLISRNETLAKLLKFGVDLFKFESKKGGANILPRIDWDKDVVPMISFLKEQADFSDMEVAQIMSKNPKIFRTPFIDIEKFFIYFKDRKLSLPNIAKIVSTHPEMFNIPLDSISKKLIEVETMIYLREGELNSIIVAQPKIVIQSDLRLKNVIIKLRKQIGFRKNEIRKMVIKAPNLFIQDLNFISLNYLFLNRSLGLIYDDIVKNAAALVVLPQVLEFRVQYLLFLKRYQPDPTKALYTPLATIVKGEDSDFCNNVAHTSVDMFWKFTKTM